MLATITSIFGQDLAQATPRERPECNRRPTIRSALTLFVSELLSDFLWKQRLEGDAERTRQKNKFGIRDKPDLCFGEAEK